eukprot:CAMPEP_0170563184 /NCGR_PEP_ID=MMETSP0211-20121228/64845_1 /TAXON_ID=311385 /ORGANISM="Pseudokeronopsis sp., Strain OXSARD2" /LENGTH=46 /DNA_ID= /DNA_START= /DNA_END= /DNA_ORIENTATION=
MIATSMFNRMIKLNRVAMMNKIQSKTTLLDIPKYSVSNSPTVSRYE